jgi:hypothetical protein
MGLSPPSSLYFLLLASMKALAVRLTMWLR